MEYLVIFIVVLIGIIIYGYIFRKKVYSEVDKLEMLKIDIMNRPVTEEISKVKQLNMTGQTEEKFEQWRNAWDDIVTNELPSVEELLFDAEEAADRYRFKKARNINQQIQSVLNGVEEKINLILVDLQELIGSEEQNKVEIEELKAIMKKQRKLMLTSRHTFGSAVIALEQQLDDVANKFIEFDEKTEGGNYLEAREVVLSIRNGLDMLNTKLEEIPKLFTLCLTEFPSQINEIRNGQREMIETGYVIEHLEIDKELNKIEVELQGYFVKLEQAEITDINDGMADIKERIEQIYDCLEKEVIAKHFVSQETPSIDPILQELQDEVVATKQESIFVQQSYHLKDKDLEEQHKIEKKVAQTIVRYEDLLVKLEENKEPASLLREILEEIKTNIESVTKMHHKFTEMLHSLRKDEREAKEQIVEMRKTIIEAKSLIRKNHLPGLPESIIKVFDTSEFNLRTVTYKLEEKPLDMYAVNTLLAEAKDAVDKLYEKTEEMVEKARLVEQVIQYGNRYRSKNAFLAAKLSEAEQYFRMYDYDLALEEAATAIEQVEPGAIKKLNEMIES
ncbi:septation ring formation regulator EzrA [Bacillus sp. Marseille-P3661]|uniref:septation ring formation regulator EzrA n=1 Tax=Bacillus sp. Marseille-P3661 TaxID=1936234 RepID=UPI000C8430D1|nr:septation ring formation regulator EzrA [Bacillus sp. Marseille-P3661]